MNSVDSAASSVMLPATGTSNRAMPSAMISAAWMKPITT